MTVLQATLPLGPLHPADGASYNTSTTLTDVSPGGITNPLWFPGGQFLTVGTQIEIDGGQEKSERLADTYRALCSYMKIPYFNAGSVISTDGSDGVHFTERNNRDLGVALAAEVRRILA